MSSLATSFAAGAFLSGACRVDNGTKKFCRRVTRGIKTSLSVSVGVDLASSAVCKGTHHIFGSVVRSFVVSTIGRGEGIRMDNPSFTSGLLRLGLMSRPMMRRDRVAVSGSRPQLFANLVGRLVSISTGGRACLCSVSGDGWYRAWRWWVKL